MIIEYHKEKKKQNFNKHKLKKNPVQTESSIWGKSKKDENANEPIVQIQTQNILTNSYFLLSFIYMHREKHQISYHFLTL